MMTPATMRSRKTAMAIQRMYDENQPDVGGLIVSVLFQSGVVKLTLLEWLRLERIE